VLDVGCQLQSNESQFDAKVVNPEALVAGGTYYIGITYLKADSSGKETWHTLYDYSGISASIDNPGYQIHFPRISVSSDPFMQFTGTRGTLQLDFPPSVGKQAKKALNVPVPVKLPAFAGESGLPGNNGQYGTDGTDGRDLELEIARYNTKGTSLEAYQSLLIVFDAKSQLSWIIDARTGAVVINASGGRGGKGADGEDRTLAKNDKRNSVHGGDGSAGGRGGRGGTVSVTIAAGSDLGKRLDINILGGTGGSGGKGGSGETRTNRNLFESIMTLMGEDKGKSGEDGSNGQAGRFYILTKKMDQMFLDLNNPLFDRTRLMP